MSSRRVTLERLQVKHAAEMVSVLADPQLYRFTGGEPPTESQLRERYARLVAGRSPDGRARWCNWVVRRTADAEAVGWIQATVTGSGAGRTAELAWTIAAGEQGRGSGREAAGAAIAALRDDGVTRFVAHVHPDHAASAAVARALGMAPTGQITDGEMLWETPA